MEQLLKQIHFWGPARGKFHSNKSQGRVPDLNKLRSDTTGKALHHENVIESFQLGFK